MLNSFNSWMKPRKEGSTGDSQGGDTFLNVEKGCLFLLTAKRLLQSFEERAFPAPRSLSCIVGKFDWQSVPERCVDLCNAVNGRLNVVPDGNHVIDPKLVRDFWRQSQ